MKLRLIFAFVIAMLLSDPAFGGPFKKWRTNRPTTQSCQFSQCTQTQCQTSTCATGCYNGQCSVAPGFTALSSGCPDGKCAVPQVVGNPWGNASPWKK